MTRALRLAELLVLVTLGGWLLAVAALVQLEGYDGLDSVLNARFFTGQWPFYTETRGPFVGAWLAPAELTARVLGLHALDLRPHHAWMAALHAGYLLAAYAFVRRAHGPGAATLLAFVAAVPTFAFFSYAPFVSHDVFPGALLLGMLVLGERFARSGAARELALLALLGALALLVKPMFGLFWLCVLGAEAASADWGPSARVASARRLAWLAAGAAASLFAFVLASAVVTASVFPELPFALRGLRHLQFLVFEANQKVLPEPVWVYVRNLPAYGPLAMAALVPGLVLSLRGTPTQRRAAVALVIAVCLVHALRFGSVRYLVHAGPLVACVIVPALARALASRAGQLVAGALLLSSVLPLSPYDARAEAARIALPFYREHPLRAFLAHAEDTHGRLRRPVYIDWELLSFASERDTPFAGDLYHDLFHVGPHHLIAFYDLQPGELRIVDPRKGPKRWPDGAVWLHATAGNLINPPTWARGRALHRDQLTQRVLIPAQREDGVRYFREVFSQRP